MIKNIEKVIRRRKSIRTYSNIDIEQEKRQLIVSFMSDNSIGLFGNKVDFFWIDRHFDDFKNTKFGTYGVISGTKYFIAGKVRNYDKNFEDYGYCMENLILFCTQMNIGTCWLGGTFKKTVFSEIVDLHDDEFIPAITPVGYFGSKKSTIDKIFRRVAGSEKRKPFDEIFFSQTFSQNLTETEKKKYGFILEMIRLAPSASNKQPWRVVVMDDVLHFFMKRTPNYNQKGLHSDLQRVDMGIAFSHVQLAMNEKNMKHKWFEKNPDLESDEMTVYIASCKVL